MPEMLTPTSAIVGAGLHKDVALLTDGRFSGGSHGFIVGHITPEAHSGGPVALVEDGDEVSINAETLEINVDVSSGEMAARRERWIAPDSGSVSGVLKKYRRLVSSASEGCITDGE